MNLKNSTPPLWRQCAAKMCCCASTSKFEMVGIPPIIVSLQLLGCQPFQVLECRRRFIWITRVGEHAIVWTTTCSTEHAGQAFTHVRKSKCDAKLSGLNLCGFRSMQESIEMLAHASGLDAAELGGELVEVARLAGRLPLTLVRGLLSCCIADCT